MTEEQAAELIGVLSTLKDCVFVLVLLACGLLVTMLIGGSDLVTELRKGNEKERDRK